jgi:hypothetical protein
MIADLTQQSALGTYLEHCKKGGLAYQVCTDNNQAFSYPCIAAPGTGSTNIEWRVSKGLCTVYATNATQDKVDAPLNIALIGVDFWLVLGRAERHHPSVKNALKFRAFYCLKSNS